jgi:nucleoside-diphosphate-sugar epimerase
MKILVTGGCGFIGHQVVYKLEQLNHEVLIIDNHKTYGSVPEKELLYLLEERKKYIQSDILNFDVCDFTLLYNAFATFNPDIVIHLASYPRQKSVELNPQEGSKTMMEGLVNTLELSKNRKFVYISSSMVYGDFKGPAVETQNCNPKGLYAIMKNAGELMVKDYSRRYGMEHVIIRPSAVYGPRDVKDRVIAKFMINTINNKPMIVKGSDEKLDFTYVEDTAEGIVLASLANKNKNVYNITRGQSRTLLDAANIIQKIAGKGEIILQKKDDKFPSRDSLCIDAAINDLEYKPKTNLEEGLKYYYEWLSNSIYWFRQTV